MDGLKPCPFCGGRANDEMQESTDCGEFSYAQCMDCGARTDGHITSELLKATLAIAWNTRADGWISVDDELPESCGVVYIWPRPDFGLDCHSGYYYKHNNEWMAQSGHKVNVTHWMPLPAPPKA